jgi:thiol-disulfide isomerase/thioredoxin
VAALEPGDPFPPLALRDAHGKPLDPPDGETLYAVFKTTCPTCELTWPFLDRIGKSSPPGLRILAVSQDDPGKTAAFNQRLGVGLETVYDLDPWTASDELGVTNVPTLFRVGPKGIVDETIVGFDRARMEGLSKRAAALAGRPAAPLFRADEHVPAIKPG